MTYSYRDEDIIYVLTKEDVDDVAKSLGVGKATDEHYRAAQKAVEWFCGGGGYTWFEAIADGLKRAEDDLHAG